MEKQLSKPIRIEAIDIFRALTMFLMIFVNDFWSLRDLPHWLEHAGAGEDMLGFSDVIFPSFLFVMGMSIPFAIKNREKKGDTRLRIVWHIVQRTVALLVMGVFMVNYESMDSGTGKNLFACLMVLAYFLIWAVYPRVSDWRKWLFAILKLVGVGILVALWFNYQSADGSPFAPRWWGILGLIGWTYVVCAVAYLFTRDSILWNSILWGVFVALSMLSASGVSGSVGLNVLLPPGGGTLQGFTLGGLVASLLMSRFADPKRPVRFMGLFVGLGGLAFVAGLICHRFWIVSKLGDTPTWLFYCLAIALPLFALVYYTTDVKQWRKPFAWLKPAGTATLTCYLIPYLFAISYHSWIPAGSLGLIKSALYSALCIGIVWLLLKVKVQLKV